MIEFDGNGVMKAKTCTNANTNTNANARMHGADEMDGADVKGEIYDNYDALVITTIATDEILEIRIIKSIFVSYRISKNFNFIMRKQKIINLFEFHLF